MAAEGFKMPTIGQRFEQDTELRCSRCAHLHIVPEGEIVRPCSVCMHIKFDKLHAAAPDEDDTIEIGLSREEIESNVRAVLKARGGMDGPQIDAVTEAVGRAVHANNRRLQADIEAAFRALED